MAVQYNKLFKMVIDRKMTNNQLAKQAGVSLNIITRLKRDEYIAMQTIEKICIALDCGVDDILLFQYGKIRDEPQDIAVHHGACRHQCNTEYLHPCEV